MIGKPNQESGPGGKEPLDRPGWTKEMPFWTLSATLHLLIILGIGSLLFSLETDSGLGIKPVVAEPWKEPFREELEKRYSVRKAPEGSASGTIRKLPEKRKLVSLTTREFSGVGPTYRVICRTRGSVISCTAEDMGIVFRCGTDAGELSVSEGDQAPVPKPIPESIESLLAVPQWLDLSEDRDSD